MSDGLDHQLNGFGVFLLQEQQLKWNQLDLRTAVRVNPDAVYHFNWSSFVALSGVLKVELFEPLKLVCQEQSAKFSIDLPDDQIKVPRNLVVVWKVWDVLAAWLATLKW